MRDLIGLLCVLAACALGIASFATFDMRLLFASGALMLLNGLIGEDTPKRRGMRY